MTEPRLRRLTLVAYGLGSAAPTLVGEFCGAFLLLFYTEMIHLDPIWVGYAFFIRMIIDALVDPAIGVLSDRSQFKAGRRRPFFLAGSLPGLVCLVLTFVPPDGPMWVKFIWLTLFSTAMACFFSMTAIPHLAMAFELAANEADRVRLVGYRNFVESFSSLAALLSIPLLLGLEGSTLWGIEITQKGCYLLAVGMIGVMGTCTALWGFFGTFENSTRAEQCQYKFGTALLDSLKNHTFRWLLIVYVSIFIANKVAIAQLFLTLEHFHGKPADETIPVLLFYFLGCFVSVPFSIWGGNRFGTRRTLLVGLIIWPLTFLSVIAAPWTDSVLMLIALTLGASFTMILAMLGAITPEALDLDRNQSGLRREGLYASVMDMVMQAGLGIGYLMVGITLQLIGYRGGEVPSESVILGLRCSTAAFPVLLGGLAIVVFRANSKTVTLIAQPAEE